MNTAADRTTRFLNKDIIKYIAMFTMALNHISTIFLQPGTWLGEAFRVIGYFTAITMIYFLIEGYRYTHSHKAYFTRLLIFAVLSEIPFCLAFSGDKIIEFTSFNMIFTLCLCYCIIHISQTVEIPAVRISLYAGIIFLSIFCDWAVLAPVYTLLFIRAGTSFSRTAAAYLFSMALLAGLDFLSFIDTMPFHEALLYSCLGMIGICLSAICILFFYNGKRMIKGRRFSQWFFYIFYPAHLLILGIIRIALL